MIDDNSKISKIIIEKIENSHIKPISKNIFLLKKIMFWSLILFSIILGSIIFGTSLFVIVNSDTDIYRRVGYLFVIKTLPYFWVILFVVCLLFAGYYYRKTLFGYRRRLLSIVIGYVVITIFLGIITYNMGVGKYVDYISKNNIPTYHNMNFSKEKIWSNPEAGLLYGVIKTMNGSDMLLIDARNKSWKIDTSKALVSSKVRLQENEIIKIIGKIVGEGIFFADEIRPWTGQGKGYKVHQY